MTMKEALQKQVELLHRASTQAIDNPELLLKLSDIMLEAVGLYEELQETAVTLDGQAVGKAIRDNLADIALKLKSSN